MRGWGGRVRVVAAATAAAAVALGLGACGSTGGSAGTSTSGGNTHSSGSSEVKVAVQGPLSGPQASTGQDMVRGAQLAASQIDVAGGVAHRKVAIVPADDAADPARGKHVAEQEVSRHVAAVVGPFNSAVGITSLPVYRRAGIPILRLTSAADTEGYGVTTQPMVSQIAPVEAKALTKVLHATSVAILYDPSTYTAAIAHQLAVLLRQERVAVPVALSVPPDGSTADIAAREARALALVAAARPSVTYLAMYGPQAGQFARQMAAPPPAQGSYGKCFADLAAQGAEFTTAAGSAASACVASGVPSATELPGGFAYVAAYEARFHVAPGTWGAFTYDSVKVLAQSAARSGTWAGSVVDARLVGTKGFVGVTGSITFQPHSGNRVDPPVVILDISPSGDYQVDPAWQASAGGTT